MPAFGGATRTTHESTSKLTSRVTSALRLAQRADRNARRALKRARTAGPRGPAGPTGPQGPKGDVGPATGPAGGDLKGSYPNPELAAPETVHSIGAAGEPGFASGWQNVGGSFEAAGFYKDREGVVHLRGSVRRASGSSSAMFALPGGYRPAGRENFAAYGNGGTAAGVTVNPDDGTVSYVSGDTSFIGLAGISFRTG